MQSLQLRINALIVVAKGASEGQEGCMQHIVSAE